MKPRTKMEKRVEELAAGLPALSMNDRVEMERGAVPHFARTCAGGVAVCLDCGGEFRAAAGEKSARCPHCGAALEVLGGRKRVFRHSSYAMKSQTFGEFQVLRMFLVSASYRLRKPWSCSICEVFQHWIGGDGSSVVRSLPRHCNFWYSDIWNYGGEIKIRKLSDQHLISPYYVVGSGDAIPELKRNGFDGDFRGMPPFQLFKALLGVSQAETLAKVGEWPLLRHLVKCRHDVLRLWPSIKVALRHGARIAAPVLWCDTVDMLKRLGKDALNPSNLCFPDNEALKEAHDECVRALKRRALKEARRERMRRDAERRRSCLEASEELEKAYSEAKSRFLDIAIFSGDIEIRPLRTVAEFLEEGEIHGHCVFVNEYYSKGDSLVLRATVGGRPAETIEVSLSSLEVLQSRGGGNLPTERHEDILSAMRSNMNEVARRLAV